MLDPADDPESVTDGDEAAAAEANATDENSEDRVDQSSAVEGGDEGHDLSAVDASGAVVTEADESDDTGLSVSQVAEEDVALDTSDDNEEQALPVVDVELPLEEGGDENEGQNKVQTAGDASQNTVSEDNAAVENDDGDEDSVSVAEATIDAMANVARPESELLH